MKYFKYLFGIEKKPRRGLLEAEWVIMGYLMLTLLLMLFTWTKLPDPEPMLWGRFRVVVSTLALWGVYRLVPCRFTMLCRVVLQLALLSWWYPDTFSLNRIFPNLDHHFAAFEQSITAKLRTSFTFTVTAEAPTSMSVISNEPQPSTL